MYQEASSDALQVKCTTPLLPVGNVGCLLGTYCGVSNLILDSLVPGLIIGSDADEV